MLQTLPQAIRDLTDPAVVMQRVVEAALRIAPSAKGAVIEMVEGAELVYFSTAGTLRSHAGMRLALAGSLSGTSVTTREVLRCDDALSDPRVDAGACARVGAISLLCVPLRRDDRAIGVLKISSDMPNAFTSCDERRLAGLADFVATIVATAWEMSKVTALLGDAAEHEFAAEVLRPGIMSDQAVRTRIETVLREDRIGIVLQPIVELASGEVRSAEALSRFSTEPVQGPDAWFADAHGVGLGLDLELAAVRAALRHLPNLPVRSLTINVGPATLASPELVAILDEADVSRVVLELTEHHSVSDYTALSAAIAPLRERGLKLAIDDTGAGFASLAHVVKLAPDVIKLDRGLLDGVERDAGRRAITAALVGFAAEAGAVLVAEGIEEEVQREALQELGIRYGQGYLLGRPVPVDRFRAAVLA